MIDIRLIRETPEAVRENLKRRNDPALLKLLDNAIKLDAKRRELIKETEALKQKKNEITREIAAKKNKALLQEAGKIAAEIKKKDEELAATDEKTRAALMSIPNVLHDSVPRGKDDSENVVVRNEGSVKFNFAPKNHADIATALGLLDEERAAKVAGAGFYYLKGKLALLDMALQRYALDALVKRGFTPVQPPLMMRRKPYEGVVSLADFENVMYRIDGDDLYMIATSEHPMAAMRMDEIINEKELPIKLAGVSPCFRREIGAHGKYTRGIFRVHNFNKVEQFVFCTPEDSWKVHEELQKNSEEILRNLGIAFRTVNVCTGDIGSIAAKKYDIEFLMADGQYREIGSNSNCTDYQARRLGIRYREKEGAAVKGFVHTLNNTALATSRAMVAILEQFQQSDGSVRIPKALQAYCGFDIINYAK
ncbi:MAG: serine--tRNA ligase [Candidatus Aenigmarchaeota archaeon]|nr:serine--tRNA ligase [Candidatus Aenigmarchaeota archaeon]